MFYSDWWATLLCEVVMVTRYDTKRLFVSLQVVSP